MKRKEENLDRGGKCQKGKWRGGREWRVPGVVIGSSLQPWDNVVWPWLRVK